jgi:hypothetical protein
VAKFGRIGGILPQMGVPRRRLQRGYLPFERSSHGLLDLKGSTGAFHLLRRPSAKGGSRDGFRLPIARRQTAQARTHTTGIVVRPAHSRHCRLQAAMRDGWAEYGAGLARGDNYSPGMRRARKCGVISRWSWGIANCIGWLISNRNPSSARSLPSGATRPGGAPSRHKGRKTRRAQDLIEHGVRGEFRPPLKQGEEFVWCMMMD